MEFEYAVKSGKAFFSVVITDQYLEEKAKNQGLGVIERENHGKLVEFRKTATSKMVKFWSDNKDIKLAIYETLAEFILREDLVGWVPGNQKVDTSEMAKQLARLSGENEELRKLSQDPIKEFNGVTYEQLKLILSEKVNLEDLPDLSIGIHKNLPSFIKDNSCPLAALLINMKSTNFNSETHFHYTSIQSNTAKDLMTKFQRFDLLVRNVKSGFYELSFEGKNFINRLEFEDHNIL